MHQTRIFKTKATTPGNVSAPVYATSREGTRGYAWQLVPVGSSADVLTWLGYPSTSTA
jgi:hypothetical protein